MAYGYGYEDAAGYGSYYSVPPPGGYLDAAAYLDGPGTHASSSSTQFGTDYASYAYETDRGGVYELGTTTLANGTVSTFATYDYSGGGYTYHRSVDTFTPSRPVPSGGGFGSYGSGIPNHLETYSYSSFQTESYRVGAYTQFDEQDFSTTSYTDGSSVSYYSESGRELTSDGRTVPGTLSSYSVSGFNYGDGYTSYLQR